MVCYLGMILISYVSLYSETCARSDYSLLGRLVAFRRTGDGIVHDAVDSVDVLLVKVLTLEVAVSDVALFDSAAVDIDFDVDDDVADCSDKDIYIKEFDKLDKFDQIAGND